jgi:hypothetical protein
MRPLINSRLVAASDVEVTDSDKPQMFRSNSYEKVYYGYHNIKSIYRKVKFELLFIDSK